MSQLLLPLSDRVPFVEFVAVAGIRHCVVAVVAAVVTIRQGVVVANVDVVFRDCHF